MKPIHKLPVALKAHMKNDWGVLAKRCQQYLFIVYFAQPSLLLEFSASAALADDHSVVQPFNVDLNGRGYRWISIHPDGEQWLITECTDRIGPPRENCFLFLYNIKTKRYQRYDLPSSYFYADAQFSMSGRLIVTTRRPIPADDSHQEFERIQGESEILLLDTEERKFQTIPLRKGRYKTPVMSPDETRVAYWSAQIVRPEGSKTSTSGYELHEFDLRSGRDSLFASSVRFFLADRFQYRDRDHILADAYGPLFSGKTSFGYLKKFNFSQLYCFDRDFQQQSDPCVTEVAWASKPSFDQHGDLFLYGQHQKFGVGLFEIYDQQVKKFWKLPSVVDQGISSLVVAPSGNYLAFTYPTASARRIKNHRALGLFDVQSERWISLQLPQAETSETIPLLQ